MAAEPSRMDVTFATKTCYKDWHKFLSGAFARKIPDFPFTDCVLYLNNGVPEDTRFPFNTYDVIPNMDHILDFFKLKDVSLNGGLWYAIAELAAVYNCKTKYLCYIQGDCISDGDWITPGIEILDKGVYSVVSPYSLVNTWGDDWHFSDQAFLIKTEDFRKPIYEPSILPDYPSYGGDSFEKMCGNFMKKNKLKRKILNDFFCHHETYG